MRKIKLEFSRMFTHQLNGINEIKKSPHLPRPRKLVFSFGFIFAERVLKTRKIKK